MLVVGEASGDAHAAHLVEALRRNASNVEFEFFGSTGQSLRDLSVETIIKADELAITGLLEIGKALPMFWGVFQKLKQAAIERKPDAVVLVDFPDFNMKLAKSLKKQGLKVIYYVSPQLWAWRSYRIKTIEKYVDLLLAILPFEKKWYAERGVNHVEFVGHPMVGEVSPKLSKTEFCRKHDLDENKPIVALLAGSRRKEVTRILPPMLDAVEILHKKNPEIQFVLAVAPTRKREDLEKIVSESKAELPKITIVQRETHEAVASADAAIVASGTATLETGLLNTPMVIVYKVSAHNWHTLRHLVNVPHYGLINLIAEERLAKELIQHECNGELIAEEILRLLEPVVNKKFRQRLAEITETLGNGGASERAAEAILNIL
ncbi:MAG: lipid-A-disaccharide synthase [Acidobacteriota bacterium]